MLPWRTALPLLLSATIAGCTETDTTGSDGTPRTAADGLDDTIAIAKETDVVFSPQPAASSHNARVAELIAGAQRSVDVMMYSFSDADIREALGDAVARGVKVRFLFDTAAEDRKLTGSALLGSKSGQLEQKGVDVRYVNKILHHKIAIVDGPRDDLERADTARIASGSANWSHSAATRYDENTLFLSGHAELALELQREFNHLWEHSRDLVATAPFPFELSALAITPDIVPDDPGLGVFLTSANFTVAGTTFSSTGQSTVASALVTAIQGATRSIHVASGHLRSRPIAEALKAKKAEMPSLDLRVYLDGQEYISKSAHKAQVKELEACLSAAGTSEPKKRACLDKGFLFGYDVGLNGVDVRYKYYAYRWHASYAKQMHNKYLVIDGTDLYTGSYNLSDNAEHNTFENMLLFRGPELQHLVEAYEERFESLWQTGIAQGALASLQTTVQTADVIPLVFEPMALTHAEITGLKALIRENCPAVDSTLYRKDPVGHQFCPRP